MSEWWTYSPTSFLLFSPRTYYRLFEITNAAVWPLQIVTLALGLTILVLIWRAPAWSGRAVAAILAALWLLVAWAHHLERYDPINFAATYYAIGFAVQALLLIWIGVVRDGLRFQTSRLGLALLIYALVIHPLLPLAVGRPIAQAEVFGLTPDPTAIATLGVLLAASRSHRTLLGLPLLWCVITALTLWTMEQPEAAIPLAAAILAVAGTAWKSRRPRGSPPADG